MSVTAKTRLHTGFFLLLNPSHCPRETERLREWRQRSHNITTMVIMMPPLLRQRDIRRRTNGDACLPCRMRWRKEIPWRCQDYGIKMPLSLSLSLPWLNVVFTQPYRILCWFAKSQWEGMSLAGNAISWDLRELKVGRVGDSCSHSLCFFC